MVEKADINGDGQIQFDEYVVACTQFKGLDPKKIKKMANEFEMQNLKENEKNMYLREI